MIGPIKLDARHALMRYSTIQHIIMEATKLRARADWALDVGWYSPHGRSTGSTGLPDQHRGDRAHALTRRSSASSSAITSRMVPVSQQRMRFFYLATTTAICFMTRELLLCGKSFAHTQSSHLRARDSQVKPPATCARIDVYARCDPIP